jgi:hypothetical protein
METPGRTTLPPPTAEQWLIFSTLTAHARSLPRKEREAFLRDTRRVLVTTRDIPGVRLADAEAERTRALALWDAALPVIKSLCDLR